MGTFCAIMVCVLLVSETPLQARDVQHKPGCRLWALLADIKSVFLHFNRVCWIVWILLAFMNFTWGSVTTYVPTFMGKRVFGGDPTAPDGSENARRYEKGAAEYTSFALWGQALLSCVVAPVFPIAAKKIGESCLWAICFILHGCI